MPDYTKRKVIGDEREVQDVCRRPQEKNIKFKSYRIKRIKEAMV